MSKADLRQKLSRPSLDRPSAAALIDTLVHTGFDKHSKISRIVEEAHEGPPLSTADRAWIEKRRASA